MTRRSFSGTIYNRRLIGTSFLLNWYLLRDTQHTGVLEILLDHAIH